MKVVGFLVCGPNEADRYLQGTLDNLESLCNEIVCVGNNTDPKTEKLLKNYYFYRDDREWGLHQPRIKTDLLKKAGYLHPDWIIPLDADEEFDSTFTRAELEKLADTNALAYYFYIVNMWNDPEHYWSAASFWNIRAYKYAPEYGLEFVKKNVHCGLAPPYAYKFGRYAPHHVRHWGLMKQEDRDKKVLRYKKYDPDKTKVGIGAYYDALAEKRDGSVYNEEVLQNKVRDEVARMNQKDKKFTMENNEVWLQVQHPKGRNFEIRKKEWSHYVNQGCTILREFTMQAHAESKKISAPIVEEESVPEPELVKENKCVLCGKEYKTESALKAHKTRSH